MNSGRVLHTATLLPDGRVLVAGGIDDNRRALSASEMFDPADRAWQPPIPLNEPRYAHTATVLSDGTVLVAGGYGADNAPLASAERFNGTAWIPEAPMNHARAEHTATVLPNGDVVLIGGGPLSVDVYTPTALGGRWAPAGGPPASAVRYGHRASLTFGRILITGGSSGPFPSGTALATAESFFPGNPSRWQPEPPMLRAHVGHTATVLRPTEQVLVVGGGLSAEIFDPITSTWSPTRDMHSIREFHAAEAFDDGHGNQRILVVGGFFQQLTFGSAEVYRPEDRSWSLLANDLVQQRVLHTITRLGDSQSFMVAGGRSGFGPVLASSELMRMGALGAACGGAGECLSGHCVDAVCCNRPCDGACEVCDGSGSSASGECGPAPRGAACANAGACSAALECDGTSLGCPAAAGDECCSDNHCEVHQPLGRAGASTTPGPLSSAKTPLSCSALPQSERGTAALGALALTAIMSCRRAFRRPPRGRS